MRQSSKETPPSLAVSSASHEQRYLSLRHADGKRPLRPEVFEPLRVAALGLAAADADYVQAIRAGFE